MSHDSRIPNVPDRPDWLPPIPGDWDERVLEIGGRHLRLCLPKSPDLFLDDPDVIAANKVNDYMPYWSYLWPAAPPMAEAMDSAPWPRGSRVLELGAGIGLVGLLALYRGDEVVFSDYDGKSLLLCQYNAELNGFSKPHTLLMDWRNPGRQERFPVIIGCEVTYDARQHAPLLNVIDAMLLDDGVCWLGDPGRYQAPLFHQRAVERGYRVRIRDAVGHEYSRPRENAFQILEMRRM